MNCEKEVLGLWIAQTEGAKFWLHVVTELKNHGMRHIFIACVDGLKGYPEGIEAVYPPIGISWSSSWARVMPVFDYPPKIRCLVYTRNAMESVNKNLRKATKSCGAFASDEAALFGADKYQQAPDDASA